MDRRAYADVPADASREVAMLTVLILAECSTLSDDEIMGERLILYGEWGWGIWGHWRKGGNMTTISGVC